MAGAQLRYDLSELRRAGAALRELTRRGRDMQPLLDDIGGKLVTSTQHRFELGIGPDGRAWKPSKRAARKGGKTLIDTTRLFTSITHLAGANRVLVGTNVVYGGVHQFGGKIRQKARTQTLAFGKDGRFASRASASRRKGGAVRFSLASMRERVVTMPARPYLGIDVGDEAAIGDTVNRYLAGAVA